MRGLFALLFATLGISHLPASPRQGFPWPPPWQVWQTRVSDPGGKPLQATGVALMKGGQIAVAVAGGVAVLSADGKILRKAEISSGENLAIASVGDDLILASGDTLLLVNGETLEKMAAVPAGGRVYQIAVNGDGSRVAVARYGKTGLLLNFVDQAVKEVPVSAVVRGVAWLPHDGHVVFSTDESLEVFDGKGAPIQTLSYSENTRPMNSPKLNASSDGQWLIASDEGGVMQFWKTNPFAKEPEVTFLKGGPWFAAFFANSPAKPFAGRPVGELSDAMIVIPNPIPYHISEVTGIIGQPDGTVVFSTWRGDIVCWNLSKATASNVLARPITMSEADHEGIPFRFGAGQAYFSPTALPTEGGEGQKIVLRFVWKGKELARYAMPGASASSSRPTAVANGDGRFVVVSTGPPPMKLLITMEQLQETPALARALDSLVEMQPSVYIVDGALGAVSPANETRGMNAYHPGLNGSVAGFAMSSGNEWSGIATLDLNTKKLLNTGQTDQSPGLIPMVFPMAADRVAVMDRDSRRIQWMTHTQREIPMSEGPAFRTKLPFKPNGAWTTTATTDLNSDFRIASPSPDGSYLAVATNRGTIDLLAWGEPAPRGCFPATGNDYGPWRLFWQDNDTLVYEDRAGSLTYRVSRDLLRPVAWLESRHSLGISSDEKPILVQAPPRNESLMADGYNHIVRRKDRRRVVWLPGISPEKWSEVPERNLAAFFMEGLWVSDVATGNIVHGYNAPRAEGIVASKENIFTRGPNGAVFDWLLPNN